MLLRYYYYVAMFRHAPCFSIFFRAALPPAQQPIFDGDAAFARAAATIDVCSCDAAACAAIMR